jgi:hypothetical protein
MALITLVVLIGGAFAIAVIASEKHFGQPRRRPRNDDKPDRGP